MKDHFETPCGSELDHNSHKSWAPIENHVWKHFIPFKLKKPCVRSASDVCRGGEGASPDLPSPFLFRQMMSDANEVRALSSPVNFFSTTHRRTYYLWGWLCKLGHGDVETRRTHYYPNCQWCTLKIASNCTLARKQSGKVKLTIKELCLEIFESDVRWNHTLNETRTAHL